jgi:hypothetical protein
MKTIEKLILLILLICLTILGCSKEENHYGTVDPESYNTNGDGGVIHSWIDNFDSSATLETNWILYGNPKPKWEKSAFGEEGLFNNNGPSPEKNYAVSTLKVGTGYFYMIQTDVMLKITNPDGTCVCPGIAVSKYEFPSLINNEIQTCISLRIVYPGTNATWYPADLRGHAWFIMDYILDDETVYSSSFVPADYYLNGWHTLKIIIPSTRNPMFFCDDLLLWAPANKMHPIKTDKKIILGFTSAGDQETSAGIAYHNRVMVTFYTTQ